jgi:hypothetical protein
MIAAVIKLVMYFADRKSANVADVEGLLGGAVQEENLVIVTSVPRSPGRHRAETGLIHPCLPSSSLQMTVLSPKHQTHAI